MPPRRAAQAVLRVPAPRYGLHRRDHRDAPAEKGWALRHSRGWQVASAALPRLRSALQAGRARVRVPLAHDQPSRLPLCGRVGLGRGGGGWRHRDVAAVVDEGGAA
eukprot:3609336-Prymnesium_polylepis.1